MPDLLRSLFRGTPRIPDRAWQEIVAAGPAVVPALIDILLDAELAKEGSRGDGYAPVQAVALLGAIADPAAIDALVTTIERGEPDEILYERALVEVAQLGPGILEPMLAAHDRTDDDVRRQGICGALASCGVHDERVRDRLRAAFERAPHIMAAAVTEYGDAALLPAVLAAFDAREVADQPLRNIALFDLAEAIEQLGALDDERRAKLVRAQSIRVGSFAEIDAAASRRMQPARRAEPPGRNAPCWCGSGRKYKRCHLEADARNDDEGDDADEPALGDLLLELAGDEIDAMPSLADQQRWIEVVTLAWNLEFFERVGDDESYEELTALFPEGEAGEKLRRIVAAVMQRKRDLCPGDGRVALRPQLAQRRDGLLLRVGFERLAD